MPKESAMTIDYSSGEISFRGRSNIGKKLSEYADNMDEAITRALQLTGGQLQNNSVELTPVDTGELRSRAFTSDVYEDQNGKTIVVGYEKEGQSFPVLGSGSQNLYSIYVHERTDLHHDVGQAKFLETAAKQFEADYEKAVHILLKKVKP